MNDPKMLIDCEALIREILPCFDRPVYLVDAGSLADKRLVASDRWLAWTAGILDLLLREELEKQDRWRGRGFCTLIRPDCIPSGFRNLAGCCLHELAHFFDGIRFPENEAELDRPIGEPTQERSKAIDRMVSTLGHALQGSEKSEREDPLPRWHGHGIAYVRCCCHLAYRAQRVFESIHPSTLKFIQPYHFGSTETQAMESVADELGSDQALLEILRSELPDKLVTYWMRITD
jgi:hypothetical protein